jgi:hypothetical protein
VWKWTSRPCITLSRICCLGVGDMSSQPHSRSAFFSAGTTRSAPSQSTFWCRLSDGGNSIPSIMDYKESKEKKPERAQAWKRVLRRCGDGECKDSDHNLKRRMAMQRYSGRVRFVAPKSEQPRYLLGSTCDNVTAVDTVIVWSIGPWSAGRALAPCRDRTQSSQGVCR